MPSHESPTTGIPIIRSGIPIRGGHGYRLVTVQSMVGDKNRLEEEFLLHHGGSGWTMLRRSSAKIDDVRIKGVGTFAFDPARQWRLKKKVTPTWSELPAELHVVGTEDALTAARIAFAKEVIGRAEFRPMFEAHVFRLYTERMYPEFEAMADDEKAEWADRHPRLTKPGEIWALLGRKCSIFIETDSSFHVQADASWDPEHGLALNVKDWRIEA